MLASKSSFWQRASVDKKSKKSLTLLFQNFLSTSFCFFSSSLAHLTPKVWDLSSVLMWQHAFSVSGVMLAGTWDPKPAKTHSRCVSL